MRPERPARRRVFLIRRSRLPIGAAGNSFAMRRSGFESLSSTKLAGQRPARILNSGERHGESAETQHKFGRLADLFGSFGPVSAARGRAGAPGLHEDHNTSRDGARLVLTLSQLAAQLGVPVQTLYDLRSQGRGPRGFRVGPELRFRVSEVDVWLAQMESDDAERHPRQAG